MTRKLYSLLRVISVFGAVLIVFSAFAALAQTKGAGQRLAKSHAAPELALQSPMMPAISNSEQPPTAADPQDGIGDQATDSSTPLFLPGVTYGAGGDNPFSIAIGDLNRDGKLDAVVVNVNANKVSVLLGNGHGWFRSPVTHSSGGLAPRSVTAADVNGDGKLDLLVANECATGGCANGSQVGVLLGNGNGGFQPAVTFGSGGTEASSIAVADVNVDGKPDLVVANSKFGIGNVGLLLGKGDGTFQQAVTYSTGGDHGTDSVAIADVNGDGKLDLIVANSNYPGAGTVGVLLGKGDGTFEAVVNYHAGGNHNAIFVAVGDLNGDGSPDLVVANPDSDTVGVLLGNGDGTFQSAAAYAQSGRTHSVAIADVNGDGKPDVLVANVCPSKPCLNQGVGVLLGNGAGTFLPEMTFKSGAYFPQSAWSVAVADANGDGKPDILVTNLGVGNSTVGVLLNNINGLHTTKTLVTTSESPSIFGQAVTFTATVTSTYGAISDGKQVAFYDGTMTLGLAALSGGVARFTTSLLSGKRHVIKATYVGDATLVPSSGTVTQVVNTFPTTIVLASNLNPSAYGQAVTFTATVTSTGPNTPTGKVNFSDGTAIIGSAILSGGLGAVSKSKLAVGTHPITARYIGDYASSKSTSSVLNQVVK